jgi:hypothetical protein
MNMPYKTSSPVHDANVQAAELAFQLATAVPYGSSLAAATARAADIARLSAIVASGQANGISVVNQQVALQNLLKGGNP